MSMLKSSVAKVVAAAIALSAGTAAFAAIGPNEGPSNLFIAVWNPATSTSYVQDLGSTFSFSALTSSFNTNGFTAASAALDGGNLSTALGASSNYSFALFAGDLTVAQNSFLNYLGNTSFLSQTAAPGATVPAFTNGAAFSSQGNNATYIDRNMNGGSVQNLPATTFLATDDHSAGSQYWAATSNVNAPTGNFTLGGFNGSASGTGTLNLLKYVSTAADDATSSPATGSFVGGSTPGVFSLNDATGVLSYSAAGAVTGVPLPAALWLLVSGLLGVGAVGRRKAAAAV
jgi:hypothetical protein